MDPRIAWALAEIERRLERAAPLEELAARVNLSSSRFAHLFRAEVGVAPARYLRDRRLERARRLLDTTFLTVKEVMAAVGINDASHFTREFRRCHGLSPRQWRIAQRAAMRDPHGLAGSAKK